MGSLEILMKQSIALHKRKSMNLLFNLILLGVNVINACESCRTVVGGSSKGRYQLVTENDLRCPDGCLYRRDLDLYQVPPNTDARYCFTKGYKLTQDCAVAFDSIPDQFQSSSTEKSTTTTTKQGLIAWAPYKNKKLYIGLDANKEKYMR